MGLALPALAGELLPERTRRDVARVLSIRHAGIAVALAADRADRRRPASTRRSPDARLQGTAALLDASLAPEDKIEIAPALFAGLDTDDPRQRLEDSIASVRGDFDEEDRDELDALGARLDDVVTGAVRGAFRVAFVATALMALGGGADPAVGGAGARREA